MKIRRMNTIQSESGHEGTVAQWKLLRTDDFLSSMNTFNANILAPSSSVKPHQHESDEQIWFILSGVGIVKVGDEEKEVREGDAVYLPPRLTHTMRNTGTYPLRLLAIGAKIK